MLVAAGRHPVSGFLLVCVFEGALVHRAGPEDFCRIQSLLCSSCTQGLGATDTLSTRCGAIYSMTLEVVLAACASLRHMILTNYACQCLCFQESSREHASLHQICM